MTQNTAAVIQAITSIVNLIFVGGIFIILRNGVVSYAKLFDIALFKQLKEEVERLEDGITQGIESCYLAAGNNAKFADKGIETELSNLQKHRYMIISKLYDYDTKV